MKKANLLLKAKRCSCYISTMAMLLITFPTALLAETPVSVYAESAYKTYTGEDGVQYKYYEEDGGIIIYEYDRNATELVVPQMIDGKQVVEIRNNVNFDSYNVQLKKVTLPEGLLTIGTAFNNCYNLETVIMPDTVTEISHSAFYRTPSLKEINWSANLKKIGDYAFYKSTVPSAVLPEGLLEIGSKAFMAYDIVGTEYVPDMAQLKELVIPDSVEKIGECAFYAQARLTSEILLPSHLKEIGAEAFCGTAVTGDIVFPEGLTSIPARVFSMSKINSVSIPEGVTVIDEAAFSFCEKLNTVSIPESVTTICDGAFGNCSSLSIRLSKNVTKFNQKGLEKETQLPNIFYGVASVEIAEDNPMYSSDDCYIYNKDKSIIYACYDWSREYYTIPDTVKTIGYASFNYTMHAKNIIIPDSVTKIDDCAFQNSALQEVIIPDSVTELGECSFSACGNLEKVTLSKNLSVIPQDAFSTCCSLKQITIPDSVISIEVAAFRDCDLLESITFSKNFTFGI